MNVSRSRLARSTATNEAADTPGSVLAARSGVRMRPARPARALLGALLVVAAVVAALALYSRLGDRTRVLALNRTVLAGEQITSADLRVVGVSSDDAVAWVEADDQAVVVGQFARYRLPEGALLVDESVQSRPLVTPGKVLVAVAVATAEIPVGLREQTRLVLVVAVPGPPGGEPAPPILVEAVVVAVPADLAAVVGGTSSGSPSYASLTVEIDPELVAVVSSADSVGVALVDPLGETPDVGALDPAPATVAVAVPDTATAETGAGADESGADTAADPVVDTAPAASPTASSPAGSTLSEGGG